MLPRRFNNLRPYLASYIFPRFPRPAIGEMAQWLFQPGKEGRAKQFITSVTEHSDYREVRFRGYEKPFFYSRSASWLDLCQTIDECLNEKNWHHFITPHTLITETDVVVDCGAAEGLFSFTAAFKAKKVFAIEPMPFWHGGLAKTFQDMEHVSIIQCGTAHKNTMLTMTDDEIYSRVSKDGTVMVPIRTIDSLFEQQKISFLKADIEGFEFQMLLGAEETIRRDHPKIALTVYHNGNDFIEMTNFLKNIHSDYRFQTRGIAENGNPIMLYVF